MPKTTNLDAEHKIHVPLPRELYLWLKQEAERSKQPATVIAREALEQLQKARKKAEREEALRLFIAENAGTEWDYDPVIGEAGLETISASSKKRSGRRKVR